MRYLMPFDYFAAVARAGSVRKAADELSITSSALNRRIQDMESELGTELFTRVPQGLQLNAAGEVLLAFTQAQHRESAKLKSLIAEVQGLKLGTLRLAVGPPLSGAIIPQALAEFSVDRPRVSQLVRNATAQREEVWLRNSEVELACVLGRVRAPEFEVVVSAPRQVGLLVPQDHALASKAEARLHEVYENSLVVPPKDQRLREVLEHSFSKQSLPLNVYMETDQVSLARGLVSRGIALAFALTPPPGTMDLAANLAFVPIAQKDVPMVEVQALKLRSARLSPLAEAFVAAFERALEL